MTRNVLIAVLRNDLRLHDHPIFHLCAEPTPASAAFKKPITHVLPVYVWDQRHVEVSGFPNIEKAGKQGGGKGQSQFAKTRELGIWRTGIHRTKFINESVFDLRDRLRAVGSDLAMFAGTPESVVPSLIKSIRDKGDTVEAVYLGREINTEEVNVQRRLDAILADLQCPFKLLEGKSLIHSRDLGFPVKQLPDVFTHFRKQVESPDMFREPVPAPDKLKPFAEVQVDDAPGCFGLSSKSAQGFDRKETVEKHLVQPLLDEPVLGHKELLSKVASSPATFDVPHSAFPYRGGETEALQRLEHYFGGAKSSPAAHYKETRNQMLGADYSTKFAAALAHGLLSPRLIAQRATELDASTGNAKGGGYWILFELLWRDYFYFVGWKFGSHLFTLAGIEEEISPRSAQSKAYEWKSTNSLSDRKDPFVRWATARTGVPLIDANMVELVHTGFMSNRGRQNVASFLTKDLGWNWRHGAEFFESWLVDYDTNSNWGNWQYVAGVGNDPRSSRQFNPIKQGKDYDANGEYVATWLPQLKSLPERVRHHPWTAGSEVPDYPPRPMIEQQMWKKHYSNNGGGGGGGGGGNRSGHGGNRRGGGGGRGRGSHRGRRGGGPQAA
ncbi:cryptochrome DASH-like [Moesziomyces antarcticus]|uniref:Cryptochrome DASH n=2 Tax=Pseudozyma antarctica TaxID=84753 RepID=A0A081CBV6_PSEA2|nr:cryptochrome DASH-like [Moesziomyces antarcticus]GAK64152.1 cryptochrome DASH-like [Moesziomyces antarcticus]SPO44628.1 related to Deoxyribodipyrimidine photolyase [Moesziomyces antarcticus]